MRVFIELVGHFMKLNRSALTRSAKKSKIEVHAVAKIPRREKSAVDSLKMEIFQGVLVPAS